MAIRSKQELAGLGVENRSPNNSDPIPFAARAARDAKVAALLVIHEARCKLLGQIAESGKAFE